MNRVTRRSSVLVLLSALACAGCESPKDVQLPEEDRLLEDVMESYVTERFRFYPVESTLSGLPGNDDRLGSFAATDIERRIAWLSDFHHRLMGLHPTALSQPAYLDALWLTSLVKAELFELEERRLWSHTASFYADHLRLGIVALLAEGDLEKRADALAGRLEAIPKLLGQARENLGPAERLWQRDGLASLESCRRLLRDLPEMLEERLPAHRVAELAELSRRGARAVQELIERIPMRQGEPEGRGFAIGEDGLSRYFLYHHMVDRSLEVLMLDAEEELDRKTHELAQLALSELPAKSLEAALSPQPILRPLETEVMEAEKRVIAFLRERDGAASPDTSIPVRKVPEHFPVREAVRLWRPKALEPARGAFLMVRDTKALDRSDLELLTLREAGGRARQYAYQAESASLLRRVLADETTSEGWLATFERDVLDEGYESARPELRLRYYQRVVVDLLRLIGVLEIHARGRSLEEVATLFEDRGFLSSAAARAEAERVAVDPGASSAALGRLLAQELASDYFRLHPLKPRTELEARLLAEGLLPLRLIRFGLLPASQGFH